MMAEAELQHLHLCEMGIWGKAVRIQFGGGYEDVWVQTIGDRSEAIERGQEAMQRKLLEFRPGGERAEALMEALMLAPPADLLELVLDGERPRMQAQVYREMRDPVAPRRDRVAGESRAAYEARVAEHRRRCEELAAARQEQLEARVKARREALLELPREELAELARPRRIDVECWNVFACTCDDWVLFRGVRRADDHGEQYLSEISEVQGLHPEVKGQLRESYRELEAGQGDELPKCSAATPSSASTT